MAIIHVRSDKKSFYLIIVHLLSESSIRWSKTVWTSPFFFILLRYTRAVISQTCRNIFLHVEVLWNIWSTHWYLLLYSIIDITSKNRNYWQEMDANNTNIFKISNIVAFSDSLFIALIGAFMVQHDKVTHRCHSQDYLQSLQPLPFVNTFILISAKRWILFLKSLRKICSDFF